MSKEAKSKFSHNRSYNRTWLQTSIVEYTWEIKRAMTVFKLQEEFCSTMFPEPSLYKIKFTNDMNTFDVMKNTLKFYLLTTKNTTEYRGICDVCIVNPSNFHKTVCQSTSGLISNMTLIYETTLESLQNYIVNDNLIMYFEIELLHNFFTECMHIDMMSSTILHEELNSKILMLANFEATDKRLITFKVKGECYSLPKKALYATSSKYFRSICEKFENKKDNTSYEIEINEMPVPFKEMLSFISSGLISDPFNYHMLRDLLIMAHKYDVQTLKLLCEFYLIRMVNIQNYMDLIQLSCTCDASFLKKHTTLFIKFYLKEIIRVRDFQRLPQNNLDKIIELIYDNIY